MKRLLIILLMAAHALMAQDAPAHLGDGAGVFPEAEIRTNWNEEPPKLLWHRRVGQATTGFVISGKHVIVGGNDGTLDVWWCIDSDSGSPKWQYAYQESPNPQFISRGPVASALIDGERVLILSKTGTVHCVDLEEGTMLWKANLVRGTEESPPEIGLTAAPIAIPHGIIVVGGKDASTLMCLSREDGSVKWQSELLGGAIQTTPRIKERDGITTAWVMLPQRVVGLQLSAEGAKEIQSVDWESASDPHGCPPLWDGNHLILPKRRGAGFATFEMKDGRLESVYDSGAEGPGFHSAFIMDHDVIGICSKGESSELVRLDSTTGQLRWSEPLPGSRGSCILVGGNVVVLCESGDMVVGKAGLSEFSSLAKIRVLKEPCWALLGFANQRIYARNNHGNALCMSIPARAAEADEAKESEIDSNTVNPSPDTKSEP